MPSYFDSIVAENRYETIPTPLWRLKVTDDQYDKLRTYLAEEYLYKRDFDECPREAALYFAEWWKRDPARKGVSEKAVFMSLSPDMPEDETGWESFAENAKRVFDRSDRAYIDGLRLVRTGKGREFKYSLFYQGGFPMGQASATNNNKWVGHIPKFVFDDLGLEGMQGAKIARRALVEYMDVFVSAARSHEPENMPFVCTKDHPWYKIAIDGVDRGDSERKLRPFSIKWTMMKSGRALRFFYNVRGPQRLSAEYVATNPQLSVLDSVSVQLFVGDNFAGTLAEYMPRDTKAGREFFSPFPIDRTIEYDGHSKISLRIAGVRQSLVSADIDMSIPHSFFMTSNGNYELGSKFGIRRSTIVFPRGWKLAVATGPYSCLDVTWNDEDYIILECPQTEEDTDFVIENPDTGDKCRFGEDIVPKWVEVYPLKEINPFVEETLYDFSDIESYNVTVMKSEDQPGVAGFSEGNTVLFRSGPDKPWVQTPPCGKVQCTVCLESGETCSPASDMLNVGSGFEIAFKRFGENECRYDLRWDSGTFFCEDESVQRLEDGWYVFRKGEQDAPIPFRCLPEEGTAFTIHVKPRYKEFFIFTPQGDLLKNGEIIPVSEIGSYSYSVSGMDQVDILSDCNPVTRRICSDPTDRRGGIPEAGPLSLLLTQDVQRRLHVYREGGCNVRIRYCEFTVMNNPLSLAMTEEVRCLSLQLREAVNPDDPYASEMNLTVSRFHGHLILLDEDGEVRYEIAPSQDGYYRLPEAEGRYYVVSNQRGYLSAAIYDNGTLLPFTQDAGIEDPFADGNLSDECWIRARRFMEAGLQYDIPLFDLPWIGTVMRDSRYLLSLLCAYVAEAKNDPLRLSEAGSRMSVLMDKANVCNNSLNEAFVFVFDAFQKGAFPDLYASWLSLYSRKDSDQNRVEYTMSVAAKVQMLLDN